MARAQIVEAFGAGVKPDAFVTQFRSPPRVIIHLAEKTFALLSEELPTTHAGFAAMIWRQSQFTDNFWQAGVSGFTSASPGCLGNELPDTKNESGGILRFTRLI
jgi:hypothetical protein